jgi:uncharacterized protein
VAAALDLFADKATVPFLARSRKERTGGLDEVQLRAIDEARTRLGELDSRRTAIKKALTELGKLTPALEAQLDACAHKPELEDLYAPYKTKRKTRADKHARQAWEGWRPKSWPNPGTATRDATFLEPFWRLGRRCRG